MLNCCGDLHLVIVLCLGHGTWVCLGSWPCVWLSLKATRVWAGIACSGLQLVATEPHESAGSSLDGGKVHAHLRSDPTLKVRGARRQHYDDGGDGDDEDDDCDDYDDVLVVVVMVLAVMIAMITRDNDRWILHLRGLR